jgi:hypothetical protein
LFTCLCRNNKVDKKKTRPFWSNDLVGENKPDGHIRKCRRPGWIFTRREDTQPFIWITIWMREKMPSHV